MSAHPQPTGFRPAERDIVAAFMAEHDVPGAAVAIVENGAIRAEGGFGAADLRDGRPPTAHTRFPVASLTKSFTGAAAVQLAERGALDLDAPIIDVLPGLVVVDADATRRLSMRRLLTHTGGLGRTGHQDRVREEAVNPYPTREALLAALHEARLQSPPGRHFSYSNEGYAIAGRAIEATWGKPLEECLREHLLAPAGMTRSAVHFGAWRSDPDRAWLYAGPGIGPYGSGERHAGYEVVDLVADYRTFLSTGGIVSTAHDLALYQCATMDTASRRLDISAGGLDAIQSVQFPFGDSGWGYGLGYWVMWSGTTKVIGHSGGLPGVSTYSLMVPSERFGIVVLTNRSDVKAMGLAEQLANEARGRLWRDDPAQPLPIESRTPPPTASELEAYAGDYAFRRGPSSVAVDGKELVIASASRYDGPARSFLARRVGPDHFVSLADGHSVSFLRDATGAVGAFLHSGYVHSRTPR